ncbi:MAG: efflux RND transporter periplasmic adaptor subunit [Hyphomicrobiales bacterium]
MNKKIYKKILLFAFVGGVVSILFLPSCSNEKRQPLSQNKRTQYIDTIPVQIYTVEPYSVEYTNTFVASLAGIDQANVVSKIGEIIIGQEVSIGDKVVKGQTLINLDKGGSESNYYQTKATFEKSKLGYIRNSALYQDGAISLQSLDAAKTEYNIDSVNFVASEKQVEIPSPISGVVTSTNFSIGDLAVVGKSLMVVSDLNSMKASFFVDPSQLNLIKQDQKVRIFSDLDPKRVINGTIAEISKSGDPLTRKFKVQSYFRNTKDLYFLPDMFVKVEVDLKTPDSSLAIPQVALVPYEDQVGVYVVRDGKSYFKIVEPGLSNADMIQILTGVQRDDKVVVRGQNALQEGSSVSIRNYPILNDSVR